MLRYLVDWTRPDLHSLPTALPGTWKTHREALEGAQAHRALPQGDAQVRPTLQIGQTRAQGTIIR